MANKHSKIQQIRDGTKALLQEPHPTGASPKWHRFIHFWVLVGRSFVRNRCPVRASALAYASLLALIPMLAIVMSITTIFLKKEGEKQIDTFINHLVASVTPPATLTTNATSSALTGPGQLSGANSTTAASDTNGVAAAAGNPSKSQAPASGATVRPEVADSINGFIQNTRSGAMGITGSVVLIFVAISMLSRIEATFNDIWGVQRGRSWFMRIVLYWCVLSLAPILLIVALGLATGPQLTATKKLLATMPFIGSFLFHFGFQLLPIVLLCLTFAVLYMLMPNTRVDWRAALVGGLVSGLLFHLNNLVSVLYVSRVVSNSKIYGSLALVPVFMIGLYFSWIILLFGAQVAYAYQNRAAYLEEKQLENVNQRGREFIALRLMTLIAQRYVRGEPAASIAEMGQHLGVPTRLVRQILQALGAARLVAETAGTDGGFLPARPMENITCHDVLEALRGGQGQELSTREEPARAEVYGEFQRIQEAERQAASSINMLALVQRAQAQLQPAEVKALE